MNENVAASIVASVQEKSMGRTGRCQKKHKTAKPEAFRLRASPRLSQLNLRYRNAITTVSAPAGTRSFPGSFLQTERGHLSSRVEAEHPEPGNGDSLRREADWILYPLGFGGTAGPPGSAARYLANPAVSCPGACFYRAEVRPCKHRGKMPLLRAPGVPSPDRCESS